ncbi:discoidin domain-containing protein [Sunxiuqinia elliptica]|uniref:discoidin domain-containing protein n=1 Tax=Sunxiuqinia elliptica TaxID=655355 RepID=UPI000B874517|nr:discoidin domain-containing protein [Sunxiuqinia elliptica]
MAPKSKVSSSATRGNEPAYGAQNLIDNQAETYWTTNDDQVSGEVEIEFPEEQTINYVLLQEYITLGQRIKSFNIEARIDDQWQTIGKGTTIGYKRIVPVESVVTNKLKITIQDSKACPVISNLEIY